MTPSSLCHKVNRGDSFPLRGISVQVYKASSSNLAAAVIHTVPQAIMDNDVKSGLRAAVPVHHAQRIGKSKSFKLMFAAETFPVHVTVGRICFKVKPSIEKPRKCHKWYRFGHVAIACF